MGCHRAILAALLWGFLMDGEAMEKNFLTKEERKEGCVRAFRRAWYNPVFKDFLEAAIWNWLFQNAQYERGSHRINGQYVELDVGEVAFTLSYLAKGFRVSEKVIRNVIKKIEKHDMGAIKSTNKMHVLKILKYTEYQTYSLDEIEEGQTKGMSKGKQGANKGQTKGNNTKESKELKEMKKPPISPFDHFEEFWMQFPRQRRGNKEKAKQAYAKAIKENRANEMEILDGVQKYAASDEVARGYAKGAAAWLNDDRWTADYSVKPSSAQANRQREQSYEDKIRYAFGLSDAGGMDEERTGQDVSPDYLPDIDG